jgi:large subunit ribosomal protein L21
MYAVIETGGKQHRVQVGDIVKVERLGVEAGKTVVFDRVLMVGDGDSSKVGGPLVDGASVKATVVENDRHSKVLIYTFKRRQNSNRRRMGHRQDYTAVKIDAIEA